MTFFGEAAPSAAVTALYDADIDSEGFVMDLTRAWAHQPACWDAFSSTMDVSSSAAEVTPREQAILVCATASTRRDPYCSLAWGDRLAGETDPETAAAVLRGIDAGLQPQERLLARWARQVVVDPNTTTSVDVQALRDAGYSDAKIVAMTVYIGLRLAFSTVNAALGACPDRELGDRVVPQVRAAVDYGRPVAD